MRVLSDTLLAVQRALSVDPVVRVVFRERVGEVARLRWERLYSGAEPEAPHALAVAGDGALLRIRLNGGNLEAQRVPSPGPGSDFSSWTVLNAAATSGIGASASGSRALVAYVHTDGVSVRVRESPDGGQTWGAAVTVATAPSSVGFVTVALRADGNAAAIYATASALYAVRRTSGVWGAAGAWPHIATSFSGLAACHDEDWNLAIAATSAAGKRLWTCILGDGVHYAPGSWGPLVEVMTAEQDSPVAFSRPFVASADRPRLFFVESSTAPATYDRAYWTVLAPGEDYTSERWREPVPIDLLTVEGVAIAASATDAWLSMTSGVWRAALEPPDVDVTDDVLELEATDGPQGGRLSVTLRNDDGRYSGIGAPDVLPNAGCEVEVYAGCNTAAGEEIVLWQRYWVDGCRIDARSGASTTTVTATSAHGLLAAWRARRQFAWAAGASSVYEILAAILGRAGLRLVASGGSSLLNDVKPAFTIHPGEDGLSAAEALLAMVPDALRFDGAEGILTELSDSEEPGYTYGPEHAIRAATFNPPRRTEANRARVFGAGVSGEAFDWDAIVLSYDRLTQVADRNVTTGDGATARAVATLRRLALERDEGEMAVPPHAGQELYDVIRVVEPLTGVDAVHRVRGLALRYRRRGGRPLYEMIIKLGAV